MANDYIPTQGTQVYFSSDDTTVEEIGCPLTIDVGASTADSIDTTCLSAKVRTSMPGLKTLGQITIVAAVQKGDDVYGDLIALANAAMQTPVPWFIGLADGTDDPTVTTGELTPPADRSGYTFDGYVSSVSPQIEANNVVKYSLVIQPTTDLVWVPAGGAAQTVATLPNPPAPSPAPERIAI